MGKVIPHRGKVIMERDVVIDTIKGIGIIIVVMGHLNYPDWIHDSIYLFHMPLFFIVSGILFTPCTLEKFISKRTKRLLAPIFPYMLLIIPMKALACYYKEIPIIQGLLSSSLLSLDAPIWFIPVFFCTQMIFFVIIKCNMLLARIFIMTILTVVGFYLISHRIDLPFYTTLTFFCFPLYLIGYLLKLKGVLEIETRKEIELLICAICILVLFFSLRMHLHLDIVRKEVDANPLFVYIPLLSGFMLVFYTAKICVKFKINRVFSFLGRNSYTIMLLHWPIINVIKSTESLGGGQYDNELLIIGISMSLIMGKMLWFVFPKICPDIR